MATSITGIVVNCDFWGTIKVVVFAPYQGAGINVDLVLKRNLVKVGTYNTTITKYDNSIGAYIHWESFNLDWFIYGSVQSPEFDNGSIEATIQGETDSYKVNYSYISNGYEPTSGMPQGIGVTYNPCNNGKTRVFVNSEPRPNTHYDYSICQQQTCQLLLPTVTTPITPDYILITSNNGNSNPSDWIESNTTNLSNTQNSKSVVFDLGEIDSIGDIKVKILGTGGINDTLEQTFNVICSTPQCLAGGNAPDIVSNISNVCPSNTVDLATISVTNNPNGADLEWFNSNTPSSSTLLSNLVVGTGTYYAAFYDPVLDCYSPISTLLVTINSCSSSTLSDDTVTTPTNTNITGSVTGNDTVNCTGTITYRIKLGSQTNGVFTIDNLGNYNFTPDNNFVGLATATYEVLCDGIVLGEANINVTVTCVSVSGGTISGNSNTTINVNETYSVSGLTGTAPYTYTWSGATIVSGQGTDTVVITPTVNTTIQCIVTNCNGTGTVTLTKSINVKVNCRPTIHFKYNCGTATNLVITKENTIESNRIIYYDSNTGKLTFTADVGTLNYILTFTANNLSISILLKNITC